MRSQHGGAEDKDIQGDNKNGGTEVLTNVNVKSFGARKLVQYSTGVIEAKSSHRQKYQADKTESDGPTSVETAMHGSNNRNHADSHERPKDCRMFGEVGSA